jgi:hypothetical protein
MERGLWREKGVYAMPEIPQLPLGFKGPCRPKGARVKLGKMTLAEARPLLASQPDFAAQNGRFWVTETCAHYGAEAVFNAKFHCELSAIEYFWGSSKAHTRAHCDYTLAGLRVAVPKAMNSVSIETQRRHFAHVIRYMHAYRNGTLNCAQVEWCMRKYTSHRRVKVPTATLDDDFLTPNFLEDMPVALQSLA